MGEPKPLLVLFIGVSLTGIILLLLWILANFASPRWNDTEATRRAAVTMACIEAGGDLVEHGERDICWDTKSGRRIFLEKR